MTFLPSDPVISFWKCIQKQKAPCLKMVTTASSIIENTTKLKSQTELPATAKPRVWPFSWVSGIIYLSLLACWDCGDHRMLRSSHGKQSDQGESVAELGPKPHLPTWNPDFLPPHGLSSTLHTEKISLAHILDDVGGQDTPPQNMTVGDQNIPPQKYISLAYFELVILRN